jgi:hypothetical protein
MRNGYTILIRKREGKKQLGNPRRRWAAGRELDRDLSRAHVNTLMNLRIPNKAVSFLTKYDC